MADRFERRYSLPKNLYIEGSPVVIVAGALLKDTITGKMLAQIKLRNIGLNNIQAVKVKLKAYEPNGDEIDGVEEFQYIDLNAGHGDEFGQKTPIYFPNNSTRKFDICVTEVVLNGTEPWVSDTVEWKPLPTQELIYHSINNTELEKQYKIEVGEGKRADQTPKYIPDITLDLFRCTCGNINPESSTVCLTCGRKKEVVFKALDHDLLKQKIDLRLEEEKKQEEQRKIENEKKEKIKKVKIKRFKMIAVLTGTVIVLISILIALFHFIIPNIKYNNATNLYKQGKYDEAFKAYTEIVNYKDAKKMRDKLAYKKASNLFKNGEYKKVKEIFKDIKNDYENPDKLKKILLVCDFHIAEQELKNGNIKTYKKIISNILITNCWTNCYVDNEKNKITFDKDGSVIGVIDSLYSDTSGNEWSITKTGRIRLKYSYSSRDSDLYTIKCNDDIMDNNEFSIRLLDSSDHYVINLYDE